MAFQIRKEPTAYFPKRKAQKKPDYLSWLHNLPCVVTGKYGVEAAHISFARPEFGHYGRGKGTKSSDRWAVPLSPPEHRKQHSINEVSYWMDIGENPHIIALTLWGLFSEMGEDATEPATAIIMQRVMQR